MVACVKDEAKKLHRVQQMLQREIKKSNSLSTNILYTILPNPSTVPKNDINRIENKI